MKGWIVEIIFGYTQITPTMRYENGRIILGGISTSFNRAGNVISKSEVDNISVGYNHGKISNAEAIKIISGGFL